MKTTKQTYSSKAVLGQADRLKAVGAEIRRQRKAKGVSQGELAGRVGKSSATVSKIESGAQPVDMGTFLRIAESLGTAPEIILLRAQMAQGNRSEIHDRVLEVFRQTMRAFDAEK